MWRLPGWLWPEGRRTCLGCHDDRRRWASDGTWVRLRSAGRGQEFVLDCEDYPEAVGWLAGLLQAGHGAGRGPVAATSPA